jgi:hypothetical protein
MLLLLSKARGVQLRRGARSLRRELYKGCAEGGARVVCRVR